MNPTDLSRMISARAAALTPYTPGEQPKDRRYVKLNTNENPYPPAPAVESFLRSAEAEPLRLYPDPESTSVREALSAHFGLRKENFFIGNGSDEVLSFLFYALFDGQRGPLLFPEHTYSFYPVYCSFYGIAYRRVPLTEDFLIDTRSYIETATGDGTTGIIFPNPNAPTGAALTRAEIGELLTALPPDVPLVIDEAYVDFGAETAISLIEGHANLVVVQTLSKNRSLAGLRLGYAVASPEIIRVLETVKNSFNSYPVDRLSQEIAVRAIADTAHFEQTRTRIMRTRERTAGRLSERGWTLVPSAANFLFAAHPRLSGEEVYTRLKERGILVRYFGHPGIEDFVRISIGSDEEMERLIGALEELEEQRGSADGR